MEQNQQGSGQGRGRRGHFHRGRRGPDRRGQQEARSSQPQAESQSGRSDHVDVEQIMRDIRARIAHRHGIDLSPAQIHELAARRLEAILDPRNVDPTLLDQLRKAAGERSVRVAEPAATEPSYAFEDSTLYESSRGILTSIRRLLNPILKLFFNPNPLIQALNTQVRINAGQAARELERDKRQTEWNALHYELVQRVVTENARLSLELEALLLKVESLGARLDFADRRVRGLEAAQPSRPGRPPQESRPAAEGSSQPASLAAPGTPGAPPQTASASDTAGSPDGQRRKRRRRRGRRSGGPFSEGGAPLADTTATAGAEGDDFDEADDSVADDGAESVQDVEAGPAPLPAIEATVDEVEATAPDSGQVLAGPADAIGPDTPKPSESSEPEPQA